MTCCAVRYCAVLCCARTAAKPLPPHHLCCPPPAGTPASNATFFCEALSGNCFLLRRAAPGLGFYQAADLCASFVGGNLVVYSSRAKQLLVGVWLASIPAMPHSAQNE